jgi:hypothetical protein
MMVEDGLDYTILIKPIDPYSLKVQNRLSLVAPASALIFLLKGPSKDQNGVILL